MCIRVRRNAAARVLAAAALVIVAVAPTDAAAHGFVSFHFGLPLVVGPPVYYYPPPPPPPAYYYYYYAPPPANPAAGSAGQSQQKACHEIQTTAVIDGKPQPVYGTACQQPDGTWRITQ
jgi:hypothetical protein